MLSFLFSCVVEQSLAKNEEENQRKIDMKRLREATKNRNIEMRDPKTNLEPQIAKQSHTEHAHKIQTKRRSRQARL